MVSRLRPRDRFEERGQKRMTAIVDAMTTVFSVVGSVLTEMMGVPLLVFFLAAGLVPVGISIFRKMKKAAK